MTRNESDAATPLAPGATLGVMGGGQLGRMFVHAAQRMGYLTAVLDPDPTSPAGLIAHHHVRAKFDDEAGLDELARLSDAITTEFENVPADSLRHLAASCPLAPDPEAVAICQDRAAEKASFDHSAVPCAPHALVDSDRVFQSVCDNLLPGILKTASLGYDGKGQASVEDRRALAPAWDQLGRVRCVLEARLPLRAELSVIVARDRAGRTVHLPVQRNWHRDGVLARTEVPAGGIEPVLQDEAVDAAQRLAAAMDYVGVLCVEFFVVDDPVRGARLVANEMAPRPHNSGHYSIDACDVSQFDLQVRTLAGLPLAAPRLHSPCVMLNLLGDLWFDAHGAPRTPPWDEVLALPGVHLHLYGKEIPKRGRKMGHLTVTAADAAQAASVAAQVARRIGLPAA